MYRYPHSLFLSILLFLPFLSRGNVDSLRIEYQLAKTDTLKIKLLTAIGDKYESSIPDSALVYYQQAVEIAHNSSSRDVTLYRQLGTLLRYIGIIYRNKGDFYTALDYYQQALEIFKENDIQKGIGATYNNFGVVYRNLGDYPRASENYHKALQIYEQLNDTLGLAKCYNNLGIVYDLQNDYDHSIEYFQEAYNIYEKKGQLMYCASVLMNIGTIYVNNENYELALQCFQKSLEQVKPYNNLPVNVRILNNIASIHLNEKRNKEALDLFNQSLELATEIGDKNSVASIYLNMAKVFFNEGQHSQAMDAAQQSLQIAEQINAIDIRANAYYSMNEIALSTGRVNQAYDYLKNHLILKDTLYDADRSRLIMELEAQYQNDKKKKEIEMLQQSQEVQRLQLIENRGRIQVQRLVILLIFIILLTSSLFYLQKTRQVKVVREKNRQLENRNHEIQLKNKEIRKQRNEIHNQRNLVINQKNQIQQQNKELSLANMQILSGIRYAERIQSSLFPDGAYLNEHLGESFVFFKPKDIVSGDFYWLLPKDGKVMIAAADCTGHGVAGSLLSMLGIAFLNESLHKTELNTSAHYLDYLTRRFDESLLVSEEGRKTREGMEIAFCIYDKKTSLLEFSGAGSSISVVSNNKIEIHKGDRQQIGSHSPGAVDYSVKRIHLADGDMVYIYSDGYINQLGGDNGNRFTSAGFFRVLEKISPHNPALQKSFLQTELDQWKGSSYEQVDDILVLGFRVKNNIMGGYTRI